MICFVLALHGIKGLGHPVFIMAICHFLGGFRETRTGLSVVVVVFSTAPVSTKYYVAPLSVENSRKRVTVQDGCCCI